MNWIMCLYCTDCCEIGLINLRDSESSLSLKRFSKAKVKKLGKEAQVLKEKRLMKEIGGSTVCVPQVLSTCADRVYAGLLLNTSLACPLSCILHSPFDESSARFVSAYVVITLESLHKNGVLYRVMSHDVLMLDHRGDLQVVDFRFSKLSSERTFTICGMADYLAPEVVQGKGHGVLADWWALGVLVYFMLKVEMPFGSWRENELDTFTKIAKGQLNLSSTFSSEAVDLITKLLEVEESKRLGSQGPDSVQGHPWFGGLDWEAIKNRNFPVPSEITSRITQYFEIHGNDRSVSLGSPAKEVEELNTPEWLEDW